MRKRTIVASLIVGAVFGLFFSGMALKSASSHVLFKEISVNYSFEKTVDLLLRRINAQEGWHVTGVIDQQAEIIEHGGSDTGKVKIINFCNAKLSSEMLSADERKFMAVNMPLSIAVYEKSDGRVTIGLSNGYVMARLFSGSDEGKIMQKVVKDIESVLAFTHFRYTIF
jgi:uncharacterized protein (DUF302 family)